MIEPYLDVSEAQEYFDDKLNTKAWDDATEQDKLKALKESTQRINRLNFKGYKTKVDQVNEFPRDGELDIPDPIKFATCELALQLLNGINPEYEIKRTRVTSESVSFIKTTYDSSFALAHIRAGIPSVDAWQHLFPYLVDIFSIKVERV